MSRGTRGIDKARSKITGSGERTLSSCSSKSNESVEAAGRRRPLRERNFGGGGSRHWDMPSILRMAEVMTTEDGQGGVCEKGAVDLQLRLLMQIPAAAAVKGQQRDTAAEDERICF